MKKSAKGFIAGFVSIVIVSTVSIIAALETGWTGYPGWAGLWVVATTVIGFFFGFSIVAVYEDVADE